MNVHLDLEKNFIYWLQILLWHFCNIYIYKLHPTNYSHMIKWGLCSFIQIYGHINFLLLYPYCTFFYRSFPLLSSMAITFITIVLTDQLYYNFAPGNFGILLVGIFMNPKPSTLVLLFQIVLKHFTFFPTFIFKLFYTQYIHFVI